MSDLSSSDPARHLDDPRQTQPTPLDLDRPVTDTLTLTTVEGAEDYLHADLLALSAVSNAVRHKAALTIELLGPLRGLHACRLYSSAALPLPSHQQEPDLTPLAASMERGVLRALHAHPAFRFRAGVRDSSLRKQIIGRVGAAFGWTNDPSHWDINITLDQGRWVAQLGALHYSRRFQPLARTPWSTTPVVAETLAKLGKLAAGMKVHDPCCGTATLLIAAHHQANNLLLTGTDHDQTTLSLGSQNLHRYQVPAKLEHANATPIPAPSNSVDSVISNLPFGKQVGSHDTNTTLYPALLNEISRALTRRGQAVLLTEDKQLLRDAIQRTKGLKLIKERLLRYHGATPSAFVITHTRR